MNNVDIRRKRLGKFSTWSGKEAVSLNVEHELTRQRKWDKKETQEYMRHFNALKLDRLTSVPQLALIAATGNAREKKSLQMFG